jgi:hypothetical protein
MDDWMFYGWFFDVSCYCCIHYVIITLLVIGWICMLHDVYPVCTILSCFLNGCLKYHNIIIQTYDSPVHLKVSTFKHVSFLNPFIFPLTIVTSIC